MVRAPFVWETEARRELIDDELAALRELPYSLWRELLGRSLRKATKARDQRPYGIRTKVEWAGGGTDDIRVTVTLERGPFRRPVLSRDFVITSENWFR